MRTDDVVPRCTFRRQLCGPLSSRLEDLPETGGQLNCVFDRDTVLRFPNR